MIKKILLLILCAICTVGFAQSRQSGSWQGTGWAINNGYVVTNHHVVDGARTLTLTCYVDDSIRHYNGEVAAVDAEHDLAIIRITDSSFKGFGRLPYSLKTEQAEVGESVFVLGYPMTQVLGDEIKLTTGVLSSRTGYNGDASSYQISAPIQPGNSGGPLFDDDGNVIACVNAKVSDAENVGYAVKGIYVKNLIATLPSSGALVPSYSDLKGKTLPQKVKAVKQYVFTIFASTQETYRTKEVSGQHVGGRTSRESRTIESPYVDSSKAPNNIRITRIVLGENETMVEFVISNRSNNGFFPSVNISKDTYLRVGKERYVLKRTEGIAIAPKETTFSGVNDHYTFRLYFPALSQNTTSFDIIEPQTSWVFYGISTK